MRPEVPVAPGGIGGDVGGPWRHLVLVGLMGSGKTQVARDAAGRLGWPVVDLDEVVAERAGAPVAEVIATQGEPAFRHLEVDALAATLAAPGPTVVATGGGVVTTAANRAVLTGPESWVVWLRAPVAELVDRLGGAADIARRPLLGNDPAQALERLAAERDDWYAEVADAVVDTVGVGITEVTTRVLGVAGVVQ